jgi:hypothetical protein
MVWILQMSRVNAVEKLLVNASDEKLKPAVHGIQVFSKYRTKNTLLKPFNKICVGVKTRIETVKVTDCMVAFRYN